MNEVLVIIPTYNESENIIKIIESIFIIHPDINVLVVDDNSPDGTSSKVKEVIPKFKGNLDLITRGSKLGLGTAYLCGFEWAMNKDYDFIISPTSATTASAARSLCGQQRRTSKLHSFRTSTGSSCLHETPISACGTQAVRPQTRGQETRISR